MDCVCVSHVPVESDNGCCVGSDVGGVVTLMVGEAHVWCGYRQPRRSFPPPCGRRGCVDREGGLATAPCAEGPIQRR